MVWHIILMTINLFAFLNLNKIDNSLLLCFNDNMKHYNWDKPNTTYPTYPTYNDITSFNTIKSYKYSYALLLSVVVIVVFVLINKIE